MSGTGTPTPASPSYHLVDINEGHFDDAGTAGREQVRQRRVLGCPAHEMQPYRLHSPHARGVGPREARRGPTTPAGRTFRPVPGRAARAARNVRVVPE